MIFTFVEHQTGVYLNRVLLFKKKLFFNILMRSLTYKNRILVAQLFYLLCYFHISTNTVISWLQMTNN